MKLSTKPIEKSQKARSVSALTRKSKNGQRKPRHTKVKQIIEALRFTLRSPSSGTDDDTPQFLNEVKSRDQPSQTDEFDQNINIMVKYLGKNV